MILKLRYAPSRRENREDKLYSAAEKGLFTIELSVFSSEAKELVKKGFSVVRHSDSKESVPSTVSWESAFKNGIPPVVLNYIIGTISTFPKNLNWAQELYVIAARANNKKNSTK